MSEVATLTLARSLDHDDNLLKDYEAADRSDAHSLTAAAKRHIMLLSASNTPTKSEIPSMDDDRSVIYINFTPQVADEYRETLRALINDVDDFRSWATARVSRMVHRKIEAQELDQNNSSMMRDYRTKALNFVYNQLNDVLNINKSVNNSDRLEVRHSEFHANILKLALAGFSLAAGQLSELEVVIESIVSAMKKSELSSFASREYFFVVRTYTFDPIIKDITAQIRTVAFQTTSEAHQVAVNKKNVRFEHVEVAFSGFDYDFNRRRWLVRREELKDEINDGARMMRDDPTLDVPV